MINGHHIRQECSGKRRQYCNSLFLHNRNHLGDQHTLDQGTDHNHKSAMVFATVVVTMDDSAAKVVGLGLVASTMVDGKLAA